LSQISDIKDALAANLKTGVSGVQVLGYVRDQVTPPAADIRRGTLDYDQALNGGVTHLTMLIRVFVAGVTDKGSQQRLDAYLAPAGDESVKAAIESDTTLGGLIQDLHVTQATGEQTYTMNDNTQMIGSEWTVELWL